MKEACRMSRQNRTQYMKKKYSLAGLIDQFFIFVENLKRAKG